MTLIIEDGIWWSDDGHLWWDGTTWQTRATHPSQQPDQAAQASQAGPPPGPPPTGRWPGQLIPQHQHDRTGAPSSGKGWRTHARGNIAVGVFCAVGIAIAIVILVVSSHHSSKSASYTYGFQVGEQSWQSNELLNSTPDNYCNALESVALASTNSDVPFDSTPLPSPFDGTDFWIGCVDGIRAAGGPGP